MDNSKKSQPRLAYGFKVTPLSGQLHMPLSLLISAEWNRRTIKAAASFNPKAVNPDANIGVRAVNQKLAAISTDDSEDEYSEDDFCQNGVSGEFGFGPAHGQLRRSPTPESPTTHLNTDNEACSGPHK